MKQSIPTAGSMTVSRPSQRTGFTLIEMLVSAALTVLIMSLFAQIFALATGSIQDQRNVARHDQKARVVTQTVLNDLDARSYRQRSDAAELGLGIIPMRPGDSIDVDRQRGYFYYSENDPRNRVDDVLQFTVDLETARLQQGAGGDAPLAFSGRSAIIRRGTTIGTAMSTATDLDQPEFDDGAANGQTFSPAAEVSYFVRGGNLYRRVLLLRNNSASNINDAQPQAAGFGPLMSLPKQEDSTSVAPFPQLPHAYVVPDTAFNAVAGNWYADFDVAATRLDYDPEGDGLADGDGDTFFSDTSGIFVHNVDSLDNVRSRQPIALPWNRFGHLPLADRDIAFDGATDFATFISKTDADGNVLGSATAVSYIAGQPMEFLRPGGTGPSPSTAFPFIGRFTHDETSNGVFNFPGSRVAAAANPYHRTDLTMAAGDTFGVDQFEGGSRSGEDIVLTNVVAFDVQIWDDVLNRYVDLGEPSSNGGLPDGGIYTDSLPDIRPATTAAQEATLGFQSASRLNTVYGSNAPPENRVFDTWHPSMNSEPPLLVKRSQVLQANSSAVRFQGVSGPDEVAAGLRNTTANDYEGNWDSRNNYLTGDVVIPDLTIAPYAIPRNNVGTPLPYGNPNALFGPHQSSVSRPTSSILKEARFIARVVDTTTGLTRPAGTVAVAGEFQPDWMRALVSGSVLEAATSPANTAIEWTPVSDDGRGGLSAQESVERVGLKKMQITVTVRDPKTRTLRDITLNHSFVE